MPVFPCVGVGVGVCTYMHSYCLLSDYVLGKYYT